MFKVGDIVKGTNANYGTEWSYFGEYTDVDTKRYSKIELMESALRSASLRRL